VIGEYADKKTGEMHLCVKYINSVRREAQPAAVRSAAALLSGRPETAPQRTGPQRLPGRDDMPPEPNWGQELPNEPEPGF
jgi:hypothetical protein